MRKARLALSIIVFCFLLTGVGAVFAQDEAVPETQTGQAVSNFGREISQNAACAEFSKIDQDRNGFISTDEMQAYQKDKFNELDKDKSGDLSAEELAVDRTKMHNSADKDSDGKVSQAESDSQFKEYFRQMDKDKDGQVSEAEYTDYWKLLYKF